MMPRMGRLISTAQAAARLGITPPRIQSFIEQKRLPAQRIGRYYAIDEDDLKLVEHRKTGRPRKRVGETGETTCAAKPMLTIAFGNSDTSLSLKNADAKCAIVRREAA